MPTAHILPGSRGLPESLEIPGQAKKVGGEGRVYFTLDDRYVVKIYHQPSPEKRGLLERIIKLGRNLGEEERYLAWPLGIVGSIDGQPSLGVVSRKVPFGNLDDLAFHPRFAAAQFQQGNTWQTYVSIARAVAAALRLVNDNGIAHTDVSFKNFLADSKTGEAVLIDLDGLAVKGFLPAQVLGTRPFMAPELAVEAANMLQARRAGRPYAVQKTPSDETDRHSAAVLILWILLFRNVMEPRQCYDDDLELDDLLGFGRFACFSEHPTDRRNWFRGIGVPFKQGGWLSYLSLTPRLQELTRQALVDCLNDPGKRPAVREWERALAYSYDVVVPCPGCKQRFMYPFWRRPSDRTCPFCGTAAQARYLSVLELYEEKARGTYTPARMTADRKNCTPAVLYKGRPIFKDLAVPGSVPPFSRRGTPMIGHAEWDDKASANRLVNASGNPWRVVSYGGGPAKRGETVVLPASGAAAAGGGNRSGLVKPGESILLRPGACFDFGEGQRLVRVVE